MDAPAAYVDHSARRRELAARLMSCIGLEARAHREPEKDECHDHDTNAFQPTTHVRLRNRKELEAYIEGQTGYARL